MHSVCAHCWMEIEKLGFPAESLLFLVCENYFNNWATVLDERYSDKSKVAQYLENAGYIKSTEISEHEIIVILNTDTAYVSQDDKAICWCIFD